MKVSTPILLLTCLFGLASSVLGQALPREPRGARVAVEEIRNEASSFMVRVDVDHPDRTYVDGDTLQATVCSEKAGYLYLLYVNAAGETTCLFPNYVQGDNRIQAKETIQVPGPNAKFRIRIGAPFGREVLKAIVSEKPLAGKELQVNSFTEGRLKNLTTKEVHGAVVELNDTPAREWAEHQIDLTTVPHREASKKVARYGIVIALPTYKDSTIPPLPACERDAELMVKFFREMGRVDEVVTLKGPDATRANVEKLFRILPQATKPDDELFIYWTGHGASVADTSGDEADGMDELLVTYDTSRTDPGNTGILDDQLARWVQDLDGRRMVFMIDACLGGGFAGTGKGVRPKSLSSMLKGEEAPAAPDPTKFNILRSALIRTKDIGQKGTAVLASSTDKEASLVDRDGSSSVMTGILIRFLNQATGPVVLKDAAEHVVREVPPYVESHFPNVRQHPQYVDNLGSPIFLRP